MLHRSPPVLLPLRFRCRSSAVLVTLVALVAMEMVATEPARAGGGLVPDYLAQRQGLTRAWFSQVQVDPSRHRVVRAVLHRDRLIVLTTAGVLQSLDAQTGRTLWVTRVGNPDHPSLGPAVDGRYVALVNGSTLVVLDRESGMETQSVKLTGGAGGGPALAGEYVYVPMFTGRMEAYPLDEESTRATWYFSSAGRVFDSPISTPTSVVWPTDRGYLYVANPGAGGVRYRFEASSRMVGGPASYEGLLYAASASGYVYALDEPSGQQRWRHSTGVPIVRSPVVVAGNVFVATEQPALHCLAATDGQVRWEATDISQLLGVSQTRAYGMNDLGDITVLDVESGVRLGQLRTSPNTSAVVNAYTDRLYLVSDTGLVQCLHEIDSPEPYHHVAPEEEPAEEQEQDAEAAAADDQPQPDDAPAEENPFGAPAEEDSFGTPDDGFNPFDTPADGAENPFGF